MQWTTMIWELIILASLPSPIVTIISMYPQWQVTIPLKAYRLDPSYKHNFSLFNLIFLTRSNYIMSHEFPPLINNLEMPDLEIMALLAKVNTSFGIPHFLSLSKNPRISLSWLLAEVLSSILLTTINSMIFLFFVLLDILLSLWVPLVMEAIY